MAELFDKLTERHGGKPEPLHETVAVLAYEVGRMLEQAMYLKWFPDQRDARIGFFKSDLLDAIAQCVLVCESIEVDFEEMKSMGIEKALERFELRDKTW